MNTKMTLSALGLTLLIATPAFAAKMHRAPGAVVSAATAAVAGDGRVIGADPDPSVRYELERDSTTYTSSN